MQSFSRVLLFSLCLCVSGHALVAQPSSFDAGVPQTDGYVGAVLEHGGFVYVGGTFTSLGGVPCQNLAAFDAVTGTVHPAWLPAVDQSGLDDPRIHSLATDGTSLYVGGYFDSVDALPRSGVFAVSLANLPGPAVVDAVWAPNACCGAEIVSMVVGASRLYVAGGFTAIGGALRNGVAAIEFANGANTGSADTFWNPDLNNGVGALALDGGVLYVGGSFDTVFTSTSPVTRHGVAAFADNAGSGSPALLDSLWDPDLGGPARDLAVGGGIVYVGGSFATVNGGAAIPRLAAFNVAPVGDGGVALPLWVPGPDDDVWSVLVHNGFVYASGPFNLVLGGTWRPHLAGFTPAPAGAASVLSFAPDFSTTSPPERVEAASAAGVWVAGDLAVVNGVSRRAPVGFGSGVPVELSGFALD